MHAPPSPEPALDAAYWSRRYVDADTPWSLGAPSPPLMAFSETIEDKAARILLPGAGAGHELAALRSQGFRNAVALDWSENAIAEMRAAFPDLPDDAVIHDDFFAHDAQYDYILEQTFYCALPPALRDDYARQTARLLRPGGTLAGVWFDFPLTEKGPPFGGGAEEYRARLSPWFELQTLAPCFNSVPERAGKELFIIAIKRGGLSA